eukprot:PLAT3572.5.p1 GENE.PLAT3572.5~~PLAT3572.5.p1  ORF type:complete len:1921 (+),score=1267.62 PLAT3572.5:60-5822(+)
MADEHIITHLNMEVLDFLIGGDITKKSLEQINFSDDQFQLQTLRGLELVGEGNPASRDEVLEFHLENNQLESLLELVLSSGQSLFTHVQQIFASNNNIQYLCSSVAEPTLNSWPVRLDHLQELDLSFNELTSIPALTMMPHLRVYVLHHNSIRPPWNMLSEGRSLQRLDLAHNKLDWTSTEFSKAIKLLRDLRNLRELNLGHNPFVREVKDYYLHALKAQGTGDGKLARLDEHVVNKAMLDRAAHTRPLVGHDEKEDEKDDEPLLGGGAGSLRGSGAVIGEDEEDTRGASLIPTIGQLNGLLQKCFSEPASCIKNVERLIHDVRKIKSRRAEHQFLFEGCIPPDAAEEEAAQLMHQELLIDELLQNIVLLMERQPPLLGPLLRVLGYLAGVSVASIGRKCLQQLQDLMGAGDDMAGQVITVMNDVVIPQIKSGGAEAGGLRETLIMAMTEVAEGHLLGESLEALVPYLGQWLTESKASEPISALLAAASSSAKSARQLCNLRVYEVVKDMLLRPDLDRGASRYFHLMRAAENLSREDRRQALDRDDRAGLNFVRAGLHKQFLLSLRELIVRKDDEWDDAKCFRISRTVSCLDALAGSSHIGMMDLLKPGRGYVKLLVNLYQHSKVHPIILTAVFRALLTLLEAPNDWYPMRYSHGLERDKLSVQADVTSGLQQVVPLLQYLGETGSRYPQMCKRAGALIRNRRVPLSQLTNGVMHDLLVAVINLIKFYCREGQNPRNLEAHSVVVKLDEHNRETFLFACLSVPSDRVQLAVVHCLLCVPLEELDNDEVTHLVDMLNQTTNIAVGETEKVLGSSFELLTRLVLSKKARSGVEFRRHNADNVIQAALHILERNALRDTGGLAKEEQEKAVLNEACVDFLRAASCWEPLRIELRNREIMERLGAILRNEDRLAVRFKLQPEDELEQSRDAYLHGAVEKTWPGRAVEYLLNTLSGDDPLRADGVVSPRVVRRIADVLEGMPDPTWDVLYARWFPDGEPEPEEDDLSSEEEEEMEEEKVAMAIPAAWPHDHYLSDYLARMKHAALTMSSRALNRFEERMEAAFMPWWEAVVLRPAALRMRAETDDELTERMQQHEVFVSFRGLERLIFFIVSEGERVASADLLTNSFSASNFVERAEAMLVEVRDEEERRAESEAAAAAAASVGDDAAGGGAAAFGERKLTGKELLLRSFMTEGATESAVDGSDFDIAQVQLRITDGDALQEHPRAMLAAAALRCIYALLRFGSAETAEASLAVLRRPETLRLLACAAAGPRGAPTWFQYQLGSKFMTIAYDVLLMAPSQLVTEWTALSHYDLILRAQLRIMESVMERLVKHGTLGEDDLRAVKSCARASSVIARQLPYLRFNADVSHDSKAALLQLLYREAFPLRLLKLFVQLLLHDMQVSAAEGMGDGSGGEDGGGAAAGSGAGVVVSDGAAAGSRAGGTASSSATTRRFADIDFDGAEEEKHGETRRAEEAALLAGDGGSGGGGDAGGRASEDSVARAHRLLRDAMRADMRHTIALTLAGCLSHDVKHRFEVLEEFTRAEVEMHKQVRSSLMQDVLSKVSAEMYLHALNRYMAEQGMFEEREDEDASVRGGGPLERVLSASWLALSLDGRRSDKRLLVVTSHALYALREPTLLFGKCSGCSPHDFCPSGPVLLWRVPLRCVERLVIGYGGHRCHLALSGDVAAGVWTADARSVRAIEALLSSLLAHLPDVVLEEDLATREVVEALVEDVGRPPLVLAVDLLVAGRQQQRLLVATDDKLLLCQEDLTNWEMPRYWEKEASDEATLFETKKNEMLIMEDSQKRRDEWTAAYKADMTARAAARERDRESSLTRHARILTVDNGGTASHDLGDMQELAFSHSEIPTVTIGFERRKDGAGVVLNEETGLRSISHYLYTIVFPDDEARERFRSVLSPFISELVMEGDK